MRAGILVAPPLHISAKACDDAGDCSESVHDYLVLVPSAPRNVRLLVVNDSSISLEIESPLTGTVADITHFLVDVNAPEFREVE